MRIQIFSDLHNEFSLFAPPEGQPDLVILAGDIDVKARGVTWANQAFSCPTLYVCGNHEFYNGHIDRTLAKMRDAAAGHVHILENQVWIWNRVRFLGTTAWTDFSCTGSAAAASRAASNVMNDYRLIRVEASYRRLRPHDVIQRNHAAREWLSLELEKPFSGKTVVITHHAPTVSVAGDKHDGDLIGAYANEWLSLVEQADLWIFGHTHNAVDTLIGNCRVISNPRGYPNESTGFDPGLEVEIS